MKNIDWLIFDMNNLMFRTLGVISEKTLKKEADFSEKVLKQNISLEDLAMAKWKNNFASSFFSSLLNVSPREGVLCAFDIRKTSWRYDVYSGYKAKRDDSKFVIPMDRFFEEGGEFISDLMALSQRFQVFRESGIEADDVAGIVTKYWRSSKTFHAISTDQDWYQCYRHGNYCQSKNGKDIVEVLDPVDFLKTKILLGDTSDTIPNVYRGLGAKTLLTHRESGRFFEEMKKPEVQEAFDRNRILIDFENIPKEIVTKVTESFKQMLKSVDGGIDGSKLYSFLLKNELNEIYEYKKDEIIHYFRKLKDGKWN